KTFLRKLSSTAGHDSLSCRGDSWRDSARERTTVSMDSTETDLLLERGRRGDELALAELFGRYRERIGLVIGLRLDQRVKSRLDVSDVVQDTFLEAARRLADYLNDPRLPFDLWLRWLAHEKV